MVHHLPNGQFAAVIPPPLYPQGSHQINVYLRRTKSMGHDQYHLMPETLLNKYHLLPTHRDPIKWTHISG